ncbi:MAG: hypothetical protein ACJ712_09600, partial [Nitrososphaeraceae archaeon]
IRTSAGASNAIVSERISNILNIDQIQRPLAPFKAKTIAAEYKYVYFAKYLEYNITSIKNSSYIKH